MKKTQYFVCFIVFVLFFFAVGCNNASEESVGNPDPPPLDIETSKLHESLDFEVDQSYDKIRVYTEMETYPLNADKIICTAVNDNVGKGFYIYNIPLVEYNNNGNWKRLMYKPPQYETERWSVCGIEGNYTESHSRGFIFNPEYVEQELQIGSYRLVFFLGDGSRIYAPFNLKRV